MAVKTENVELGVCDVTFDNLDLGATKGGVEVSFETSTYEVKIDQFGDTPAKELITGTKITVKVPMVETDLDKLLKVMPQARAVTSGGSTVGLRIGTGINIDMLAIGKELRLHPTGRLASETKSDFGLYKAAPSANFSFSYQTGQERVYEVTFTAYPAPEFADELCWFGKKPELIDVFWGRATSSNPNEAAIEAFPGSQLRAQRQGPISFALEAGSNTTLWLAWPTDFDTGFNASTSVINTLTNTAIPFTAGTDVSVTDAAGTTRTYKVYKSSAAVTAAIQARID